MESYHLLKCPHFQWVKSRWMKIIKGQISEIECWTFQWCPRRQEAQKEVQILILAQKHYKPSFKNNLSPLKRHKNTSCKQIWMITTLNLKRIFNRINFKQNNEILIKIQIYQSSWKMSLKKRRTKLKRLNQLNKTTKMESLMNLETYLFKAELLMLIKLKL